MGSSEVGTSTLRETAKQPGESGAADPSRLPVSALLDLTGRVAVVTGGARGLGEAIADRLSEAGALVIVADLDGAEAERTASGMRSRGHAAESDHLDVADPSSIDRVADTAVARHGRLDIWVNNAGIFPVDSTLDMSMEQWERVIDIDLNGTFSGARAAARRMSPDQGGVIVNMASVLGLRGAATAGLAHYVAAKHGVVGLTKALAVELASRRIRVLAVAPGLIRTPGVTSFGDHMEARTGNDVQDLARQTMALGGMGVPDDVARVVLFCASDMSSFMTGAVLSVDGGATAR